jgi:hypothetical protein
MGMEGGRGSAFAPYPHPKGPIGKMEWRKNTCLLPSSLPLFSSQWPMSSWVKKGTQHEGHLNFFRMREERTTEQFLTYPPQFPLKKPLPFNFFWPNDQVSYIKADYFR